MAFLGFRELTLEYIFASSGYEWHIRGPTTFYRLVSEKAVQHRVDRYFKIQPAWRSSPASRNSPSLRGTERPSRLSRTRRL